MSGEADRERLANQAEIIAKLMEATERCQRAIENALAVLIGVMGRPDVIDELLTHAERVRLLRLALNAVPIDNGDRELTNIIAKLSGTDTVLIARRAYPSARVEKWWRGGEPCPAPDTGAPPPPPT
jgi:hypothetical protein